MTGEGKTVTTLDSHEAHMTAASAAERLRERLNADRFYRITEVVEQEFVVMAWSKEHALRNLDRLDEVELVRGESPRAERSSVAVEELPGADVCEGCLQIVEQPLRLPDAPMGLRIVCGDCAAVVDELMEAGGE